MNEFLLQTMTFYIKCQGFLGENIVDFSVNGNKEPFGFNF